MNAQIESLRDAEVAVRNAMAQNAYVPDANGLFSTCDILARMSRKLLGIIASAEREAMIEAGTVEGRK